MAAPISQGASPVCEIALADQGRSEVFDFAKAQGHQFGVKCVRFEITLERFSHRGDARGKLLLNGGVCVLAGARSRGIAIVEHDVRTPGRLAINPSVEKMACSVR